MKIKGNFNPFKICYPNPELYNNSNTTPALAMTLTVALTPFWSLNKILGTYYNWKNIQKHQ
jgi:hypothetical protein